MRNCGIQKVLFLLIATCIFFSASGLTAPDGATGTWKCVAKGLPDGDLEFTLELRQSGESLTGTISVEGGSVEISDGKVHGNGFEFVVIAPDARYSVTGTVDVHNIKGEWKDDRQNSGAWSGQKQG